MNEEFESMTEEELSQDNSWRLGYQQGAVAVLNGESETAMERVWKPNDLCSDHKMYWNGVQAAIEDFFKKMLDAIQPEED